jgi:D-amino-acid dehydrogenase
MTQKRDVVVIGGGVIGVCAAYYLQRAGRRVTILEQGEIGSGSSHGNAGWVVTSHSVPLATPGAILQGLRWMFNPKSPFYIKPRIDFDLFRWLLHFRAAANHSAVRRTLPVAIGLSRASLELYEDLVSREELDCGFVKAGLMGIYNTPRGFEEALEEARLLSEFGVPAQVLNASEVVRMEPNARADLAGGVFFEGDANLRPDAFVRELALRLYESGCEIRTNAEVLGFDISADRISSIRTTDGDYTADTVVLAAGAWSPRVVKELGLRLPVQPAKGYSITFDSPGEPLRQPLMLAEARIGATPLGQQLRLAGTLELSGINLNIRGRRVDAIREALGDYLTYDDAPREEEVWVGMRPLSPDGLPMIGRPAGPSNLVVATGHSMTGMTQGPITGLLVSQIVLGEPTALDIAPLSPQRFGAARA